MQKVIRIKNKQDRRKQIEIIGLSKLLDNIFSLENQDIILKYDFKLLF